MSATDLPIGEAIVRKSDGHPSGYLFITLENKEYFLGVLTPGITRVVSARKRYCERCYTRSEVNQGHQCAEQRHRSLLRAFRP